MKRCVLMRVKDEKEDIITRSERVQERHKNGTALRVVSFSRERDVREGGREIASFSHHRFKNSNARDERPQHQDIIIIIATQTRAVNKERERKNTCITEYLETG